jgi:DNA-binding MarR family transcriptional regulator
MGEGYADESRYVRYMSPTENERDDEVDLLIDAWSRRLPDVDLTPLDVMSRLRRAANRLARLRADAFKSAGLASWEFDVLAALRRTEEPHELSPAQLIQRTMIGSAAMTNRITHLVERGLVDRQANPRDGRGVLVQLTAEGAVRVDAAMTELIRREARALSVLSRDDIEELARVLRPLMG